MHNIETSKMDDKILSINAENKTSEEERECGDTEKLTATEIGSLFHCVYLNTVCHVLPLRRLLKRFISDIQTLCLQDSTLQDSIVFAGSAAEGTFIPGCSDFDIMLVLKHCLSIDTECLSGSFKASDARYIFIADQKRAAPGYVILSRARQMPAHKSLFRKLTDMLSGKGNRHVSYQLCKEGNPLQNTCCIPYEEPSVQGIFHVSGPARHVHLTPQCSSCLPGFHKIEQSARYDLKTLTQILGDTLGEDIHMDMVFVIPYKGESILTSWLRRKRRYGWPSPDLLQEVSGFAGYLAPVGQKGSSLEDFEWRICYTTVEQKLVNSFNEVQFFLYHQLKAFTNTHLKAGKKVLTSYVLKNIVFWLSESVPSSLFQHRYFIALFRSTLVLLRSCINSCHLPNYIIPERNLLGQIISKEQKLDIFKSLTDGIKTYPIHEWKEIAKYQLCQNLRQNISEPIFIEEAVSFIEKFKPMQLLSDVITKDTSAQETNSEKRFLKICNITLYITGFCWRSLVRLAQRVRDQQPTAPDLFCWRSMIRLAQRVRDQQPTAPDLD